MYSGTFLIFCAAENYFFINHFLAKGRVYSLVPVVYFLVDLLMDGEILKDLESTLIYDAMFFLPN